MNGKYEDESTNIFELDSESLPKENLGTWLVGRPLSTADAPNETIGKLIGLAVFSSDALSSVAYGPQEILMVLVLAGMGYLHLGLPVAIGIVALLALLTFSYEQTIHAYPNGGGAYIVARDNLGELPALIAAAALLTDYILTVSVSISSGVAQIVSAFPNLFAYRVEIAVAMILFIMLLNLRGVRESGTAFAIPTYIFIGVMIITIFTGLVRWLTGTLGTIVDPPHAELAGTQTLTLFLILRAFSNGTASVTGVEAISNGITAFKEPRSKNAGATLLWMALILGSMLLSITFLAIQIHAVPVESETIISQIARTVYGGRGIGYLATIAVTMLILMLAANTAYNGFPRLGALTAEDGFIPRQFAFRGSRLVYSNGIVLLALVASALVVLFQASVTRLIPLYAIGVFLSFTLSQAGMAMRWYKSGRLKAGEELKERGSVLHYDKSWTFKMIVNGFGALTTFTVMIIFAVTKFHDGAYIVIFLIPALVFIFMAIHRHYKNLAMNLSLEDHQLPVVVERNRVILPIGGVHRGSLAALRYARTLSDDITAIHVSIDPAESSKVIEKWKNWGEGYRLVILNSPYRIFYRPLMEYIAMVAASCGPEDIITVVVPQFVMHGPFANFLHMRTAETLRRTLLNHPNVVIIEVPYLVK